MKNGLVKTVQAVDRTLTILNEMAHFEGPATLSEISRKTKLNISTTHRLLQTLISQDYVEQDPYTGRYRLGCKMIQIGQSALVSLDIRKVSLPLMDEAYKDKGYLSYLTLKNFQELIVIGRIPIGEDKFLPPIGGRMALHSSTPGRLLLQLAKSDSKITDWEAYQMADLPEENWTELSVAVYDYSDRPVAALTFCQEKAGEVIKKDLPYIFGVSWEISKRLGANGVPA